MDRSAAVSELRWIVDKPYRPNKIGGGYFGEEEGLGGFVYG